LPQKFRRIGIDKPAESAGKNKKEKKVKDVPFRRMMLHTFIIFHKASPCSTAGGGLEKKYILATMVQPWILKRF